MGSGRRGANGAIGGKPPLTHIRSRQEPPSRSLSHQTSSFRTRLRLPRRERRATPPRERPPSPCALEERPADESKMSLPSPRTTPICESLVRVALPLTSRSDGSLGCLGRHIAHVRAEGVLGALAASPAVIPRPPRRESEETSAPTAADQGALSQRRTSRLGQAPAGLPTKGSPASVAQNESEEEESTPLGGASTEQTHGTLLSAEVAVARDVTTDVTQMTPYG
ncbi:conserved hypothetical protein [Ixodes scapularis]|uniref:Uncharacterized protein n=1 Tax=Ixodes scapularis TaxID=6945 RepID=B7P6Z2_IXOSC|nr:conserved hypothetical protein [Ixodes scapularis]|eukprot:XP_002409417.1 conserved hypothetical protein [Ixodes scapularis]